MFSQREIETADQLMEKDVDKSPTLLDVAASISNKKTQEDGKILGTEKSGIECQHLKTDLDDFTTSNNIDKGSSLANGTPSVPTEISLPDMFELRGSKRTAETMEPDSENKRSRMIIIDSDDESQTANSVFSTVKVDNKSDLKENAGEVYVNPLSSQSLNDSFQCTACNKITVEVHVHPLLKVIICADCRSIVEEKMKVKV